jgi:F-type H+-transporting ATPase subunit b
MTLPLLLAETGGLLETVKQTGREFGFNGWLFISQVVSFAIVCYCLKRFAYGPIMEVLETRRQTIEQGLADAARIKVQLAESERSHQEIISKANIAATKMIEEARATAQVQADRVTAQATAEAEQIRANARESAKQEHAKMLADLKKEVTRLVVDTTSRVTGKVLNEEDHRRLAEEAAREVAA